MKNQIVFKQNMNRRAWSAQSLSGDNVGLIYKRSDGVFDAFKIDIKKDEVSNQQFDALDDAQRWLMQ